MPPRPRNVYHVSGIADQVGAPHADPEELLAAVTDPYSKRTFKEFEWPKAIDAYFAIEVGADIVASVKACYPDATSVDIAQLRKLTATMHICPDV